MKPLCLPRPTPRRRQRGAALITAMVIVTLVITIAASMVWQQWRAVQVEAAERAVAQAQWILRGALDWGILILREDARNGGADHLGEPWAVPLAEARLSSFLAVDKENNTAADDLPDAFLSGQIYDVASRYNLMALINPTTGEIDPKQLDTFKHLCEFASLSPALADGIAQALRRAWLARLPEDADMMQKLGGPEGRDRAPIMPQTVDQLVWLGVDAGTIERLKPLVSLLPDTVPVNLNTAPREVIAAVLDIDLGRAERLVQYRQRNPLKQIDDVHAALGTLNLNGPSVDIKSDFFEIQGRLRLEDRVIQQRYTVRRSGNDVTVLFENVVSGVELPAGAPR